MNQKLGIVNNLTLERQILMVHWSEWLAYLNNARLIKEPVSKCKTKQSETRHTKVMGTKEWQIGYILASSFTFMNTHT